MLANKVLGVIFANVHDDFVPNLTKNRSMASIPFGGRYRLIDFSLSNLVNAGINTVGVIPQNNYHSLMNHLGSGKAWDLDRKTGGLFILPPYLKGEMRQNSGHIDSLLSITNFLMHSDEKDVILCDTDVVSNIDILKMYKKHIDKNSDVTIAYKEGTIPKNNSDIMTFKLAEDERIIGITMPKISETALNFSLDTIIINRRLLLDLIEKAKTKNLTHLWREMFMPQVKKLNFYGYKVTSPTFVIDSEKSFADANFALLEPNVRNALFNPNRPIYTKVRDDMSTNFGTDAKVSNSLIADGCVIEGSVVNSVLFRGVKIEKGAMVKNCILMQDTIINENTSVEYILTDKSVKISKNTDLKGAKSHLMYIEKSAVI